MYYEIYNRNKVTGNDNPSMRNGINMIKLL